MENSVLKNQWYLVNKDGEPYLYVSVKKDFFAEAVRISDGTLLVGYFDYYRSLNLFILNEDEMVEDGRCVGAIAVAPSVSGKYDISGSITSSNYKLYEVSSIRPVNFFIPLIRSKHSIIIINCIKGKGKIVNPKENILNMI